MGPYPVDVTISNVKIETAVPFDSGFGIANFVEQCLCPKGYTGLSCEDCAPGYIRKPDGEWKGKCVLQEISCPTGYYGNPTRGIECQICPCPNSANSNQFPSECYLDIDDQVTCRCPQGYEGRRCESCSQGYQGNPLNPGGVCRPDPRHHLIFVIRCRMPQRW